MDYFYSSKLSLFHIFTLKKQNKGVALYKFWLTILFGAIVIVKLLIPCAVVRIGASS